MVTSEQLGLADNSGMILLLTKSLAENQNVSLILLDIDEFRKINDVGGQEGGDKVILALAACIKNAAIENRGLAFRTFADEFGLVIPDTMLEEAFLKAETIRRQIYENQSQYGLPVNIKASVSLGVASFPRDAKDVEGLIRAAAAALYTAKENGRNRVALPPAEEMIMKTCYYPAASLGRLKQIAAHVKKKESELFREALENLLRQYDDLQ